MLKKCTQLLRAVHFQVKMNFFGSWDGEKAIEAPSTFPSQNLQKNPTTFFKAQCRNPYLGKTTIIATVPNNTLHCTTLHH